MEAKDERNFAAHLKSIRGFSGFTQSIVARKARISRTKIVRMEDGLYVPRLDEAIRLAEVFRVPLEWLVSGRVRPSNGLKGIAIELQRLGIADLKVSGTEVPGAFRRAEEVVVLALRGERPEPRIVEAMPLVLASKPLKVRLTLAFAAIYDRKVRVRLAWLSDITLTLSRSSQFPVPLETEVELQRFVAATKKPDEPDSLGHPAEGRAPFLWRRWNITYASKLDDFMRRIQEAHLAPQYDDADQSDGAM